MLPTRSRGFTLLELVIVITIIGIISAIVLVALGESRAKGRDGQRAAQTQEFLKAFELYYSDNGAYPSDGLMGTYRQPVQISVIGSSLTNSGYIKRIPDDPFYDAAEGYLYCSNNAGDTYALLVNIENETGSNYCVASKGPDSYKNALCNGIALMDRCGDRF